MKLSSKFVLMVLLELSLFAVDHQAPVLYIWRMQEPVFRVVGKVESKRSEGSELSNSPWKRTTVPKPSQAPVYTPNGLAQEKRDISLEDILLEDEQIPKIRDWRQNAEAVKRKKINKKAIEKATKELRWPAGTYGLPRAFSGCPSSTGFRWKIGYRFHDTEDDGTENQHSDSFHMAGKVSDDGIKHEFCMKTKAIGQGRWPEGKYCIYKKGPQCPANLDEGFIIWDDENKDNKNSAGGTLPEGHYDEDTKIWFCCSVTGDWDQAIKLPRDRPFYLYAYESNKCQKVEGMRSISEFIKFDDEDRGNIDYEGGDYPYGVHKSEKDHMLFLCYYTPTAKTVITPAKFINTPHVNSAKKNPHNQDSPKKLKPVKKKKIDKLEEMEKLRNSEKMMDAFLASTAPHREETDKSERTKTIIKTIRVPERVKDSTASVVATTMGIVLGAILLGSIIVLFVTRHVKTRTDGSKVDTLEEPTLTFTNSSRRSSFATSDDEVELTEGDYEDELVEDQYLPSDSELKSGLELMFLKQQRHYWTKKKRPSN